MNSKNSFQSVYKGNNLSGLVRPISHIWLFINTSATNKTKLLKKKPIVNYRVEYELAPKQEVSIHIKALRASDIDLYRKKCN